MESFTKEDLKKYNGVGGKPAYIAYRGRVYDVSESSLWIMGAHQGQHVAGYDLTEEIEDAPHGGVGWRASPSWGS